MYSAIYRLIVNSAHIASMSYKKIDINYCYIGPSELERFNTAQELTGWAKTVILTQIAQTYGKVYEDYYAEAAELDAVARGYECHRGSHFDALCDWNKALPPYQNARPIFEASPLASIPMPDKSVGRYGFNGFRCSARNAAIIRLALEVEQTNIQIFMSKAFIWYYARYWHLYLPQLASVEQRCIKAKIEPD